MSVQINDLETGQFLFKIDDQGEVYFPASQFKELGFAPEVRGESTSHGRARFILLSKIEGLSYKLDRRNSILAIQASPQLFPPQQKSIETGAPKDLTYLPGGGGFLNYALNINWNENENEPQLGLPWEVGGRWGRGLLVSNFSYAYNDRDLVATRLNSNYIYDNRHTLQRLVIGDYSSPGSSLGGGGMFGGISLSKLYGLNPYIKRYSGLDINGMALSPSEVEIYVDGKKVHTDTVEAGEFVLSDITGYSGLREVQVLVRDHLGRESSFSYFDYHTPSMLKPGFNEYNLDIGVQRNNFGQVDSDYGELALNGLYRVGVNKALTAGGYASVSRRSTRLAVESSLGVGQLGNISLELGAEGDANRLGYAGVAGYSFVKSGFSIRAHSRLNSAHYGLDTKSIDDKRLKRQYHISTGLNLKWLGSLSLGVSQSQWYNGEPGDEKTQASLSFNRSLFKRVTLFARASSDKVFFFGLSSFIGKSASAGTTLSMQDNTHTVNTYIASSTPGGEGWSYRVNGSGYNEGEQVDVSSLSGRTIYQGSRGIVELGARNSDSNTSYEFRASGAIGVLDGKFYLSRPVFDGFAVVKVAELADVPVKLSNQVIGMTNAQGEAIVPRVFSYQSNRMEIVVDNIPVNYEIPEISKTVTTDYRGGVMVEFAAHKLQGISGKIFVVEGETRTAAQYWGIRFLNDRSKQDEVIGKGGEMYLQNLKTGQHAIEVFTKGKACRMSLNIPDSDEMILDLGEIDCVIENR